MRDIKFRCWNGEVMILDALIIPKDDKPIELTDQVHSEVSLNWMEYVGLKDKDGIEIYEGDVVYLAGYGNYVVEFPFIQLYQASFENDIGKIIGNIYQNPELVK